MASRSETLAQKVQQANDDLRAAVEGLSDARWAAPSANAPWNQGFVGFHAASSIGGVTGMIQGMASGAPFEPVSFAQIDDMNAQFHSEHSRASKEETLQTIATNGPASVAFVSALSDEQLDHVVTLAQGVPPMSIEQVIEMLLIGHPNDHRKSIEEAR